MQYRIRKCAENYNKKHNKFILKTQSAFWSFQTITVSECCLIKLLPYYIVGVCEKYFSIGNNQPREPALCQLYRHTFIPYYASGRRRLDYKGVEFSSSDFVRVRIYQMFKGILWAYVPTSINIVDLASCGARQPPEHLSC